MVYDFPSIMRLVSAGLKKMGSFGKNRIFQPRSETSTDSGAGIASPPRIRCTRSSCAIARYIWIAATLAPLFLLSRQAI
jgi:hypothetical protein